MIRAQLLSLTLVAALTVTTASAEEAEPTARSGQDIVSASTLKRTHTIAPAWPQSANGVEGWVLLHFTLLPDGTVADIEVKEAHPAGIFETSAVEALRQWQYEPVERDGKKIAQRAEIRVKYALPR
jgi:TonB family protein